MLKNKLAALYSLKKPLAVKLDAQTFNDNPPTDQPVDVPVDNPTDNPPVDNPVDPPAEPKTFTQEDLNRIATKESKAAQAKALKALGFDNMTDAKKAIEAYNNLLESQKTDADKQKEQFDNLQTTNAAQQKQIDDLNAQNAALTNGVKPESVDDAILLARGMVNEDTDINTAMQAVVAKYPQFAKAVVEDTKKPKVSAGKHDSPKVSEQDMWNNAFAVSKTQ